MGNNQPIEPGFYEILDSELFRQRYHLDKVGVLVSEDGTERLCGFLAGGVTHQRGVGGKPRKVDRADWHYLKGDVKPLPSNWKEFPKEKADKIPESLKEDS